MYDVSQIALSPSLVEPVLLERKRCTIRKGLRNYELGPNRIVVANTSQVIPIVITEVRHKRLHQLTKQEAQSDGFKTIGLLYSGLLEFYPDLYLDDWMTIIYFRLAD